MFNKAHASSVKSGMNSRIYRKTEPNKLDQLGEQMLLETVKLQLGFQTDVDLKISRIWVSEVVGLLVNSMTLWRMTISSTNCKIFN